MLLNLEEKLDPRVKRTRKFLEQAFAELLEEKGFQAITVQDITDRAEVNRATFYAHFSDKYALLDHAIRQSFRQEIEKRVLNACRFDMGNLKALIVAVCEFVKKTNEHCTPPQPQFESLVETQVKDGIKLLLHHWMEQDNLSADPQTAATAASWAIYGLALQWSRDKNRLPVEQYAEQVLPTIAANLSLVQAA